MSNLLKENYELSVWSLIPNQQEYINEIESINKTNGWTLIDAYDKEIPVSLEEDDWVTLKPTVYNLKEDAFINGYSIKKFLDSSLFSNSYYLFVEFKDIVKENEEWLSVQLPFVSLQGRESFKSLVFSNGINNNNTYDFLIKITENQASSQDIQLSLGQVLIVKYKLQGRKSTLETPVTMRTTLVKSNDIDRLAASQSIADFDNTYAPDWSGGEGSWTDNDKNTFKKAAAYLLKNHYSNNKLLNQNVVEEKQIAIGSSTMTSDTRAYNVSLNEKTNGEKILSFSLQSKYFNEDTGNFEINPFLAYLSNETYLKLYRPNKKQQWTEYLIKNISENSTNGITSVTAKEASQLSLGKMGYNIELSSDLMNNQGTIFDLAEPVLKGSGWEIDKNNSDVFWGAVSEPVYKVKLSDDIEAKKIRSYNADDLKYEPADETEEITAGEATYIYVPYSFWQNKASGEQIQFLYADDIKYDKDGIVYNANSYLIDYDDIHFSDVAIEKGIKVDNLQKRYKTFYEPKIDRMVTQGTGKVNAEQANNANSKISCDINRITEVEYLTSDMVFNLIVNPSEFQSTSGWVGYGKQTIKLNWNKNKQDGETIASLFDDTFSPQLILAGANDNAAPIYLYNAAIKSNITRIGQFTENEKYILDINGSVSGGTVKLIAGKYSIVANGIEFDGNKKLFDSNDINLGSGTTSLELTCLNSCSKEELRNQKIGLFLEFTPTSGSNAEQKLIINSISFFKKVKKENSEGGRNYYLPTDYIESKINTIYKYYIPSLKENQEALSIDEIIFCDPEDFTPKLYDENNPYTKISSIEISKSNRFNIIQELCETFECWADFQIEHDEFGKIISRKISFKQYIGKNKDVGFSYGINLNGITRQIESEQIVTKMIVNPNSNENALNGNGSCTIQLAKDNIGKGTDVYNFDYYIRQGQLDNTQIYTDLYEENGLIPTIGVYNKQLQEKNSELIGKYNELNHTTSLYQVASETLSAAETEIQSQKQAFFDRTRYIYDEVSSDWDSWETSNEKFANDATIRSIIWAIKTQIDLKEKVSGENSESVTFLKSKLDGIKNDINQLKIEIDSLTQNRNSLVENFAIKYSNFISEGTWSSEDYYDDDLYYYDSLNVLYASAFPKVSYTIDVVDILPLGQEYAAFNFEIGDKTWVEDVDFFGWIVESGQKIKPYREEVVISEIATNLDDPTQNKIVVQNYKTQFEDLFQRISATTAQLQYAAGAYQRAANKIGANEIDQSVLQNTLTGKAIQMCNVTNTSLSWDSNGLVIKSSKTTESQDQIRISNKGIEISHDGGDTWAVAINGKGINATYISTGQLDADKIQIMMGDQPAFYWDFHGLRAYEIANSHINPNNYIEFNGNGLKAYRGNDTTFSLTPDGNLSLVGNITATEGEIGGWQIETGYLWSGEETSYVVLSSASGNNYAIWAGNNNASSAPFSVKRDGTLYALDANITGIITANHGSIGGWQIETGYLYSGTGNSYVSLNSASDNDYAIWAGANSADEAPFSVQRDGKLYSKQGKIGGWTIEQNQLRDEKNFVGMTSNGFQEDTNGVYYLDGETGEYVIESNLTTLDKNGKWQPNGTYCSVWAKNSDEFILIPISDVKNEAKRFNISPVFWSGHYTDENQKDHYGFYVDSVGRVFARDYFNLSADGQIYAGCGYAIDQQNGTYYYDADEGYRLIDPGLIKYRQVTVGGQTSYVLDENGTYYHDGRTGDYRSIDNIIKYISNLGTTKEYFAFDPSNGLTLNGTIAATAGDIGGWYIGTHALYSKNLMAGINSNTDQNSWWGIDTNNNNIKDDTVAFWAGGENPTSDSTAFKVTHGGKLYATQATIQGKVTASGGSIGGWQIETDYLHSGANDSYVGLSSASGNDYAIWAGAISATSATFSVQKDGKLYASDANITGIITANNGGSIGGWQIGDGYLYSGEETSYVSLNSDPNNVYAIWAGAETIADAPFSVKKDGYLYSTSGSIGGWHIEPGYLYSSNDDDDSSYVGLSSDTSNVYAIWAGAGATSAGNAPFSVRKDGSLYSTSGTIGGWTIEDGWLYSGSGASYVGLSASSGDYAIWAGSSTASSAPFYVQRDGTLYSKRGQIGGWQIGANYFHIGSGANYVGLGSSGNYRIWAGNGTASSAPFSVQKDGSLYATKGSIGGWTIETGFLHSGSSTSYVGLSSASNYAIWAGNSQAENAPFGVERNGTLHATGAQITGNITATTLVLGTSAKSTLDGYYDGLGSAATAAATAVNNLQIGARNLLKDSKKHSLNAGTNNWSYWPVYWTEPLWKGQTYTISGYVEFTQGSSEVITIHRGYGDSGALDGSVNVDIQPDGYFEHTWTCAHEVVDHNKILLYCGEAGSTANKKCTYSFVKLEKGTKATGWLDAPEDLTFMISPSKGTRANFTDRDGNEFNFGIDASGNLYANNGTFSGTITATGGTIGSSSTISDRWQIGSTSIRKGKVTFTDDNEGIYVGTEGISSSTDTVTSAIGNGSLITRRGTYGAIIGTKYDSTNGYYLSLCGDYGVGVGVSTSVTKVVCGINPLSPTGSMYCKTLYADSIEIKNNPYVIEHKSINVTGTYAGYCEYTKWSDGRMESLRIINSRSVTCNEQWNGGLIGQNTEDWNFITGFTSNPTYLSAPIAYLDVEKADTTSTYAFFKLNDAKPSITKSTYQNFSVCRLNTDSTSVIVDVKIIIRAVGKWK